MYDASEALKTAMYGDGRKFHARILNKNNEYIEDIKSIKTHSDFGNNGNITVGGAYSSYVSLSFYNAEFEIQNNEIRIELGLEIGDDTEWFPIGKFTAGKPKKSSDGLIEVTAYDVIQSKMSGAFFSALNYPTDAINVLNEISEKTGIPIETTNLSTGVVINQRKVATEETVDSDGNIVEKDTYENPFNGYTYREALGYIAMLYCKYALSDRNGTVKFVWYEENERNITSDYYYNGLETEETVFEVGSVSCNTGEEELKSGTGTTNVQLENPVMTQERLDFIYQALKTLKFVPLNISFYGDALLDFGDIISVVDVDGTIYKAPIMNISQEFDGGLKTSIQSYGGIEEENTIKGAITSRIDRQYTELFLVKELVGQKANFEYVYALSGEFDNLSANYAKFQEVVVKDFDAVNADIEKINSNNITTDNLSANVANLGYLTVEEAKLEYATISKLNALSGDFQQLKSDSAEFESVVTESLKSINADIDELETNSLTAEKADLVYAKITDLNATNANISNLTAKAITTDNLSASVAELGYLTANAAELEYAKIDTLETEYLKIKDLSAETAKLGYLSADVAEIEYAKIDFSNVGTQVVSSSMIKDGAVTNEKVGNLSANKITSGTIDASKITVTNLNADNLTVGTINGKLIGSGSVDLDKLSEEVATKEYLDSVEENLQKQIDGAIETFTKTEIPTLNNEPASLWTDNATKSTHIGDICYVVNPTSSADGYCYRFANLGTEANPSYSWVLIKDSDVTKALQDIIDINGEITGIKQFDNEISSWKTDTEEELSSIKMRTTTLETDMGNKVETSVFSTLKQTVDSNTASITSLSNTVSKKADNSTVTTLSNTVNTVKQTADANTASISSLKTEVASKADGEEVETLTSTVNEVKQTADSNTASITSLSNTVSKKADSSTVTTLTEKTSSLEQSLDGFKTEVASNYATKTALASTDSNVTSLISRMSSAETSIKQNTTDINLRATKSEVEEAVNGIEIGGRNLVLDSSVLTNKNDGNQQTTNLLKTSSADVMNNIGGQTITVSFDYEHNVTSGTCSVFIHTYWQWVYSITSLTTSSGHFERTITLGTLSNPTTSAYIIYTQGTFEGTVTLRNIKIERGNKATDWAPAPEDLASEADLESLTARVTQAETDINVNSEAITLRATKTELATVSSAASAAQSTADSVKTNLTNNYYTKTQSDSNLSVKSDAILASVKSTYTTKEEFEGLEIGGRNLLINTNTGGKQWGMNRRDGSYTISDETMLGVNGAVINIEEQSSSYSVLYYKSSNILFNCLEPDTYYTVSLDVLSSVDIEETQIIIQTSGGISNLTSYASFQSIPANTWTKLSATFKTVSKFPAMNGQVLYWATLNTIGTIKVCNLKLEKGNKATDWTPAPEDLATEADLTSLETRVTQTESSITSQASSITAQGAKISTLEQTASDLTVKLTNTTTTANTALSNANAAQSDIDNLEIGGRNLARKTSASHTWQSTSTYGNDTWKGSDGGTNWLPFIEIETDQDYTLSFDYTLENVPDSEKNSIGCGIGSGTGDNYTVDFWNTQASYIYYGGSSSAGKFVYYLKAKSLTAKRYFSFRPMRRSGADTLTTPIIITISNFKLEKGNKATDWTPAPEDIESEITEAAKTATNYLNFSSSGLCVGDMTASTLGKNVLIDSASVNIRNGTTTLATFAEDLIELGKNSKKATIDLCNGTATMYNESVNNSNYTYDKLTISANDAVYHTAQYRIAEEVRYGDKYMCSRVLETGQPWSNDGFEPYEETRVVDFKNGKESFVSVGKDYATLESVKYSNAIGLPDDGTEIGSLSTTEMVISKYASIYASSDTGNVIMSATNGIYAMNHLKLPNIIGLFGERTDGTMGDMVHMSESNNIILGYGSYNDGVGRTHLYGNSLRFYIKTAGANYKPYYEGDLSDGISDTWHVDGFITSSGTKVYFTIPLGKPIIGNPTITVYSYNGLMIRQGGKYLYGSSADTYAEPDSYSAKIVGGNCIAIIATFSNTTNVTNNDTCSVTASIGIDFA